MTQHGADVNPLATDAGIAEMRELSRRHHVAVVSVCADYFMDRPFATASTEEFGELTEKLRWLIDRCQAAGITRMVMPFVDASRIETPEQENRVVAMLLSVAPHAAQAGVELHLETALNPENFKALYFAKTTAPDPESKLRFRQQLFARLHRTRRTRRIRRTHRQRTY